MLEISPSSLNQFLECPYSYYLSRIKRIAPRFKNQMIIDTGSIIHKIIETFYDIYPPLHSIEGTVYQVTQLADKTFNINEPMRRIVNNAVNNFISFEKKRRKKLDIRPLSEFTLSVRSGDIIEKGIMDIFLKEAKVVVDFKTSSIHDIYDNYKIQLTFYRRLINRKFGFNPKTYLFYLLSNDLVELEYSPEYDKIIDNGISNIIIALEENRFEKNKSKCGSCPYKYYCKGEKSE